MSDATLESWRSLPRRLYLDTGILQRLFDYGETVWEGESLVPLPWERHVTGLEEEVQALRFIMAINERAGFEFVVTEASLREVDRHTRAHPAYRPWVRDVLETWLVQSEGEAPSVPSHGKDPNVSAEDWLLLRDALAYRCDAFLTLDGPLAKQARNVQRRLGIRLLRPTAFAVLLAPWADLYG